MNNKYRYAYLLCFVVLLLLLLSLIDFDKDAQTHTMIPKLQLHMEGFCVGSQLFSNAELHNMNQCVKQQRYKELQTEIQLHPKLTHFIKKNTSQSHVLQDYIWVIERSHVNTCHRDNNGDFFNEKQRHPSYTMLIFLEDMDKCLTVYAGSHSHKYSHSVNFTSPLQNIICKKGDIIIFNANLIHVGALNTKNDHTRIQMKITHKDDLSALSYYQNFHKVANKETHLPRYIQKVQRSLSCTFPIISDMTQKTNIETSRGSDNGVVIPPHQKVFSFIFYGNSDFYDLPNAF
jgi:hypothetical protein|uniref:Phytanoyl-CoA dioxygenase n=1 Tax=viral metagenome TaxID=1070528 RepID=A0A6C0IJZ4_9ZZZZ